MKDLKKKIPYFDFSTRYKIIESICTLIFHFVTQINTHSYNFYIKHLPCLKYHRKRNKNRTLDLSQYEVLCIPGTRYYTDPDRLHNKDYI